MKKKILIIEDDADASTILERILGEVGFSVDVMPEGRSVIENRFARPDLFILDYKLPEIEGTAICRHLKNQQKTKDIPIIVISGNMDVAEKVAACGANSFLHKPFRKEELLRVVNRYLPVDFFIHDEEIPADRRNYRHN